MTSKQEPSPKKTAGLVLVLRIASVLIALMGLGVLIAVLPGIGITDDSIQPLYRAAVWILAIPCYGAMLLFRKMVNNIAADRSFCMENAHYLQQISILALVDTCLTLCGGTVALLRGDLPFLFIAAIFCIAIMGFGITAASAALSYLVEKAQKIEEENDFTI